MDFDKKRFTTDLLCHVTHLLTVYVTIAIFPEASKYIHLVQGSIFLFCSCVHIFSVVSDHYFGRLWPLYWSCYFFSFHYFCSRLRSLDFKSFVFLSVDRISMLPIPVLWNNTPKMFLLLTVVRYFGFPCWRLGFILCKYAVIFESYKIGQRGCKYYLIV